MEKILISVATSCDAMTDAVVTGQARRWPVISALGVVMIVTRGSTYYLMTVLAAPIAAHTGWGLGVRRTNALPKVGSRR